MIDGVFKALADTSRRKLLDQLRKYDGQTLGELCEHLDMTRQAVTKHLDLLEAANLVTVVWRGREKLHYLNPVPLHEIYERWIGKYEGHRLQALSDLKQSLEQNKKTKKQKDDIMKKAKLVYTTFIRSTPKKTWDAITKPEFTRQYWGEMANVSDWKNGSKWEHRNPENEIWVHGEVTECAPPKRLVLTWVDPENVKDVSRVTFELEKIENLVCLTVTHDNFTMSSKMVDKVSWGWPRVLSSLKSFLETGEGINIFAGKN